MTSYFITGSGTGIGKTLLTASLCWQLNAQGKRTQALKPVVSGYDASDAHSDTAILMASQKTTDAARISPWRFSAPLAPNMAAKQEGASLSLQEICAFCKTQADDFDGITLVEGVGGVLVPLNNAHTTLDWMQALNWPVLYVVGSYLGAISHALSGLESLLARGLDVKAMIVSESEDMQVDYKETIATLEKFVPVGLAVVQLARLQTATPWQSAPDLTQILG